MATPVTTSWSEKLSTGFRTSPGKSSTVSGLAVILVVLWCRFIFGGHPPSAASGATAQVASDSRTPFGSESTVSPATGDGLSLQQWAHQPIRPLVRNPFSIPLDLYPRDSTASADKASTQTGYWDLVGKSMSSRADQQEQRQILIDNVRIAAASLKVESTIMGAHRRAMVNENMVSEGDDVEGFRIVKIEARQIIVEKESIQLAVPME